MYKYICKKLKKKGYLHYEVSNFAKKGCESKHNLTYWNNEEYYGFGLGASSFVNGIRYTNTRSLTKYLEGNYVKEKDVITKEIDMSNEMILGLRKIEGISKNKFYNKFGCKIEDIFDVSKLKENKDYFYIDKNNLYVSNYILCDFI